METKESAKAIARYKLQAVNHAKEKGYNLEKVITATNDLEKVMFAMRKGITPKGFAFCFSD